MRKLFTLFAFMLAVLSASAQSRTVSGKVTDANGEPLTGVTVLEKGTSNGVYTDGEGAYSLQVTTEPAVLVFRGVGLKTVEKEASGSGVDVTMEEDVIEMDDVVITALGIPLERKQLGYSVQSVGGDEIRGSGETNMISGLSGKVAGVQVINSTGVPGGSSFIRIRGSRSLDGNNQPLIVVDGVPMNNDQNTSGNPDDGDNNLLQGVANSNRAIDINPDDIESVTVLKGPNAAALYGIAAANGAIVITTKRGRATGNKTVNVTYNGSLSLDQVNRLPQLQSTYAQGSGWLAYLLGIHNNVDADGNPLPTYLGPETRYSGSWGPRLDTLYWDGDATYQYDPNGRIVGQSDPTKKTQVSPYDNLGTFFTTGMTLNNNFSFSGGGQGATYRLSAGNTSASGIVPNSTFGRTSVRFNGDASLTKRLRSSASLNYVKSGGTRIQQGSNISGLMLGLLRTPPSFDNSGGFADPANTPEAYIFADGRQRNYRGGAGYDNPYWVVNQTPYRDNVDRIFGYTSLSYDAAKWLNVFYRIGADHYADRRKQIFAINSRSFPGGQVNLEDHNYNHINSDLFLTATKQFSENFNGSLLLGNNMYDERYTRLYTQGDGLVLPNFYNISNATSVLSREFSSRYRKAAVFFDAKANWKSTLFLNVTGRNEWSSTLPADKNSFFYPSASLGFVFTEPLGWTESNKILPYGKIRLSYAQVGNDAPVYALGRYYVANAIGDGWTNGIKFPIAGVAGFTSKDQLGNPNLRPERTNSLEAGLELKFLGGRIGLDAAYYSTTSVDQIFAVPVSSASGYVTQLTNAGKVTNKGIELVLDAVAVKNKSKGGFRWDVMLNYTRNRNQVVELAEGIETLFLGGFEGSSVRNVAGQPYGMLYGGVWLRDEQGNIVIESDTNADFHGFPISAGKEDIIGNPNPDFLMGLRNTFSWKGLTLTALIDLRYGGDIWNGTWGALTYFGMSANTESRGEKTVFEGVSGTLDADGNLVTTGQTNTTEVVLDEYWYVLGDGSGFGSVAEQFVQDGSFLKLRDIGLSYELPTGILEKTPFKNISVGVSGRNFILWTKYQGVDPETNLMGASNAQGLDYFNMPSTKSYLFNLNLGF